MADNVTFSGPLFNGRAILALEQAIPAVLKAEAKEGASRVRDLLQSSIKDERTGKALKSITYTDHSVVMVSGKYAMPVDVTDPKTEIAVTTSNATYGPWLEGTGSRNETTRFKGYWSFRQGAQVLQFFAQAVADEAMQPYLERMR